MKNLAVTGFVILTVIVLSLAYAMDVGDDSPSGYTSRYRLRMYNQGARPGADSVNQNLKDIDSAIYMRDKRIDSVQTSLKVLHNYPAGTFKDTIINARNIESRIFGGDRFKKVYDDLPQLIGYELKYDANEFDNDTLKVKPGVFPKLAADNNFSGMNTISSGIINFDAPGGVGSILNFIYTNDAGGVFITKNTSDVLLKFDEGDGLYWQFLYPIDVIGDIDITGSYKINGIPIANLDSSRIVFNNQSDTLTQKRYFADSVVYLGKTLNTKKAVFTDTLYAGGRVILAGNTSAGLVEANEVIASSLTNTSGPTNLYDLTVNGVMIFNGLAVSNLLFETGSTTRIGTTDNHDLEIVRDDTAKITITNTGVSILGVLSIISMTVSGTSLFNGVATFASDVIMNGWLKNGSSSTIDQYQKSKVIRIPLIGNPGTAATFTAAHGISNWRSIVASSFMIHEDSLNVNVVPNAFPNASGTANTNYTICWTDSLNCNIRLSSTNWNNYFYNDTATCYIIYTDYNR